MPQMSAFPAEIPDADWLKTHPSVRALIIANQQVIPALRQENDDPRIQLTGLATEVANLRERIGRSTRNSSKPHSSDGAGYCCAEALRPKIHRCVAMALAASAANTQTIPDPFQSCCRSSEWMRWCSITPMPAAVAPPCSKEMIQSLCAIR